MSLKYHIPIYWGGQQEKKTTPKETQPTNTLKNKLGNILFISPTLPEFDESAGGKRAWYMLKLLAEDYNVFAYTKGSSKPHHKKKLESDNVTVIDHHDYDRIKREIPGFNVIIYAWYYTWYDCHIFRDLYPRAQLIVDTVDIHWVREERSIGNWDGIDKKKLKKNKAAEVEVYKAAHLIWTVSETDSIAVKEEVPQADTRVVSIIEELQRENYQPVNNKNILFLGGYRHYPNINAAEILATEILPIVKKSIPEAKLILAGSNAPENVVALGELDDVDFKGFVRDEDIEGLYDNSAVVVVPLLAGAGVKGKICEAISYCKPVVTNKIGNEGINLINKKEAFLTESPAQMAKYVVELLNNKYDLSSITSAAQTRLNGLVGPEINKKRMVDSFHPMVSICIVTFNKVDLLKKCIDSILGNTSYPNYKILIHSNGCEDGTKEYLESISEDERIFPIISENNDVFVLPNNWMMQKFPDDDVVLLNNDVEVTENWLTGLVKEAYLSPTVGIVGSKILYPDGKLQEFGGELYTDGTGRNIGKWEDPDQEEYKIVKRASFVSGCSFFLKRSTINKVGVFDEQFHPCYCEDADYCYNAWRNGIETVVTPESIIYHFEGATSGTDTSSGFKKYQTINMKKFYKKHKQKIEEINNRVAELNKT